MAAGHGDDLEAAELGAQRGPRPPARSRPCRPRRRAASAPGAAPTPAAAARARRAPRSPRTGSSGTGAARPRRGRGAGETPRRSAPRGERRQRGTLGARLVLARERPVGAFRSARSSDPGGTQTAGSSRTERSTRPPAVSSSVSRPPKLCPITVARSTPAASSVSRTSSTCWAIVHGGSQPERPWPRRSGASTRKRSARRPRAKRRNRSPWAMTPWRQRTGGGVRVAPLVDVQPHGSRKPDPTALRSACLLGVERRQPGARGRGRRGRSRLSRLRPGGRRLSRDRGGVGRGSRRAPRRRARTARRARRRAARDGRLRGCRAARPERSRDHRHRRPVGAYARMQAASSTSRCCRSRSRPNCSSTRSPTPSGAAVLGLLYDLHGNLPALEAILAEADELGVDSWLLGGDYGIPSPWPLETLERLEALPSDLDPRQRRALVARAVRHPRDPAGVRGARPRRDPGRRDRPALPSARAGRARRRPLRARLAALRRRELRGAAGADEERLLEGVRERTLVFGHSHLAVSAAGAERHRPAEPGQRRMPLDGDRCAAWATRDGEVAFRRTEYDVERGGRLPQPGRAGRVSARRLERGSTRPARRRPSARRSPSAPSRPGSSPSPARRPRGMRPRPRRERLRGPSRRAS